MKHWESMIYGYATALLCDRWSVGNLAAMRAKCIKHGSTEGECLLVERNPQGFIRSGWEGVLCGI